MRVTFEHREARAGFFGDERIYFVDCHIEFSEEERTIIKIRKLYDHKVEAGRPKPPSTGMDPALQRPLAILASIAGFIAMFFESLGDFVRFLAFLAFIGGPLWLLYTYIAEHMERENMNEWITLRQILNSKGFKTYAYSPSAAKEKEAEIHEKLAQLKQFLMGSAVVGARQSYEI
jgi:hypothetical protein